MWLLSIALLVVLAVVVKATYEYFPEMEDMLKAERVPVIPIIFVIIFVVLPSLSAIAVKILRHCNINGVF